MAKSTALTLIPLFAFSASLIAQTSVTVNVTDPRPVLVALERIETVLQQPANYEDTPREHDDDLEPVQDPRVRITINGRRTRIPRSGTINFTFDPPTSADQKTQIWNDLLTTYRAGNRTDDFRAEQINGRQYIIATKAKGIDGKQHDVVSPMLARITIPYAQHNVVQVIVAIAAEVSKASKVPVLLGNIPLNLANETIYFGSTNEPARDALARLLAPNRQLAYRLLFDTLIQSYMLNIQLGM